MTWSDRMKKTCDTFKNMALPLYLFYLLFSLLCVIIAVVAVALISIPFFEMNEITNFSAMPYFDPNIPVPPGYDPFDSSGSNWYRELESLYYLWPQIFMVIALGALAGGMMFAIFDAGIFHLTKKAYAEKVKFADIKLKGFSRMLGWYLVFSFIGILIVGGGILIGLAFESIYSIALFLLVYALILFSIFILIAPWLYTGRYFMLNKPQLSFWQSFKASWQFYRHNMGPLWTGFLTVAGCQILLSLINRNAPDLGFFVTFLVTPFLVILPIVWYLTLEEEENPVFANSPDNPYSSDYSNYNYSNSPYSNTNYTPNSFVSTPSVHPEPANTPQPPAKEEQAPPPASPPAPNPVYSPPEKLYTPPSDPYPTPDYAYPPYATETNTATEEKKSPVNFCPTCGTRVRENASYCSQCGTKL